MQNFRDFFLVEERKSKFRGKLYHGTSARFDKFDQRFGRMENDFYGGGIAYFTTSIKIAKGYASASKKRIGGDMLLYTVDVNFKKVFDVDISYDGAEVLKILDGTDLEKIARGAGLMSYGNPNSQSNLSDLKRGRLSLTGDQLYKGFTTANRGKTSAFRDKLISLGYDALRYNGGLQIRGETQHDVYIAWDASTIKIDKRQKWATKK